MATRARCHGVGVLLLLAASAIGVVQGCSPGDPSCVTFTRAVDASSYTGLRPSKGHKGPTNRRLIPIGDCSSVKCGDYQTCVITGGAVESEGVAKCVGLCTANADACGPKGTCHETEDGPVCLCENGNILVPGDFAGTGGAIAYCADVDECRHRENGRSMNNCNPQAQCINVQGGYVCVCHPGYQGNGRFCQDINECQTGAFSCPPGAKCMNDPGTYYCKCDEENGWFGNGRTCERQRATTSTATAVTTGAGTGALKTLTIATSSTPGPNPSTTCSPTGPVSRCSPSASCVLVSAALKCVCKPGFTGDGLYCTDVDECALSPAACPKDAVCENTLGSYRCTSPVQQQQQQQEPQKQVSAGGVVTAVDVCTLGLDNCDKKNGKCIGKAGGGYACTCNAGFTGNGYTCDDIDECSMGTDTCGSTATCTNLPGTFTCNCREGLTWNGDACVDMDECAAGKAKCSPHATCSNNDGSYTCTCDLGFEGDGTTCTKVAIATQSSSGGTATTATVTNTAAGTGSGNTQVGAAADTTSQQAGGDSFVLSGLGLQAGALPPLNTNTNNRQTNTSSKKKTKKKTAGGRRLHTARAEERRV